MTPPKPRQAPVCLRCGGPDPASYGWCRPCNAEAARSTAVDQGAEPTVTDPVSLRRLAVAVRRVLAARPMRKAAS